MPAEASKTITRKIRFYRANLGLQRSKLPVVFDHAKAFTTIAALPWTATGRYLESQGEALCCWADKRQPQRVILGLVRRRDFPQLEKNGNLTPLSMPPGGGLAEQTHIVFFPKNIIGCEFNFYGPRIGRLRTYLPAKAPGVADGIAFDQLLRDDAIARLSELAGLRLMTIRVSTSSIALVEKMNSDLGAALTGLSTASKAEDIELTLRAKGDLAQRLMNTVKKLTANATFREDAKRLFVKGERADTEKLDEVDLLADALVVKKVINRAHGDSNALNSMSAFNAIEEAYNENRADLERAAGAQIILSEPEGG